MKIDHKNQKLHRDLSASASLATDATADGCIIWKKASEFPIVCFPDGAFFYEANAYLLHIFLTRKMAIGEGGATAGQYAYQLSEITRYLYKARLSVMQMRDANFVMFLKGLGLIYREKQLRKPEERIRVVGSMTLDFIDFVAKLHDQPFFVSPTGIIRGTKVLARSGKRPRIYRRIAWYHPEFPMGRADSKISVATQSQLSVLTRASSELSFGRKQRVLVLLSILSESGARISEVSELKVSHILRAYYSGQDNADVPFITKKRGGDHTRVIPVSRAILSYWVAYIEGARFDLLDQKRVNHDYLFCSLQTGHPVKTNTLKSELGKLKLLAGISERLSPHSFRHKFVVRRLKYLILQFRLANPSEMRSALAHFDVLKAKVREWLGHLSDEAIETYIHAAYEDMDEINQAVSSLTSREAIVHVMEQMKALRIDLEQGRLQETEYNHRMSDLIQQECDIYFKLRIF